MEPRIQYVRSADGTNIAYTVMGDGVPMIFSPNIWCHLAMQLTGEFREAWEQMARDGIRIAPYDMRGMGMSDREVEDFSLDSQMADIEALAGHLRFDRFALYGNVFGSLVSIAYAAHHPERVSHLILNIPLANGGEFYRAFPTLQGLETLRGMAAEHWELYTLMHATALVGMLPGEDPRRLAALMRECTTPDSLRRYFIELQTQDVRPLLAQVRSPTLILSPGAGGLALVHSRFAREVAAGIPGARLAIHGPGFAAPAFPEAVATEFVLGREVRRPAAVDHPKRADGPSGMTAILFADIADSTALTERMGDTAFRDKARDLDAAMRAIIRENAGTPIEGKLLGDGVLAVFTSARQAIEAALRCGRAGDEGGLPLHLGIHAGDVIREGDNVYGGAVNIASRISGLSAPGEVLVSETVRSLARTSAGVGFEERGERALKGVGEPVRVWAVRPFDSPSADATGGSG
jgi:class 3 adenylate cyclase/pimeloyl-ACP methyl ester carboxylesterase